VDWLTEKWNALTEFAESAFSAAKEFFGNVVGFIKSPLGFLADAVMRLDEKSVAKAWATFSGLVSTIANNFRLLTDNLLGPINALWNKLYGYGSSLLDKVSGLVDRLPSALQRIAATIIGPLKRLWAAINDGFTSLFKKIKAWVEEALDTVFAFVRQVVSFGINVVIDGIAQFGKLVLFLKDLFSEPQKYVDILAGKAVEAFSPVDGLFAGLVGQHFGEATAAPPTTAPPVTVQRQPAAGTPASARGTATWSEIGSGVLAMMGKKWDAFKADPLSVLVGLLVDLVFPIVGNIKDVIHLFGEIKKIVTGPLSAGSLEELWTSFLLILDIPILIYQTVVSILMRTLTLPLIVASFIPHPLVKGIAAAVGYGLLGAFVQGELLNFGQKLLLLKTGQTNKQQKEDAYNRIADGLIAMAMTAIIMLIIIILHFMAEVMKGVYNFVKGKVFPIETVAPEGRAGVPPESRPGGPAEGKGGPEEGRSGPEQNKGRETPTGKESPSQDGNRRLKMNEEGRCEVCASPCQEVRDKYSDVMTAEAEAEIARIEADVTLTEAQQIQRLKPVEQKLFDAQMTKNGKLIGDLSGLNAEEANFAREQLAAGKTVEVVPRGAGRTPDFIIDGQRIELKTLSGVADTTSEGISKAIARRVMDGRGQSTDVVVDARGQAGITQEIAERGIRRAYGADNATGGKITSIRVIGPGFDITIPRI
jgi:Contact-dependent growth inhibition CdiA C-terminal domain